MDIRYDDWIETPIPLQRCYRYTKAGETLKPWLVPSEMHAIYDQIATHSESSIECYYYLDKFARQCTGIGGEYWVCGAYKGGSVEYLAILLDRVKKASQHLRVFDTFSGNPPKNAEFDFVDDGLYEDVTYDDVAGRLARFNFVTLHQGHIPDAFERFWQCQISFLHCDLSLYQSTMDCLSFCYSRVRRNGIILIEDYGRPTNPGVRQAADDYFASVPEQLIVLKTGQAFAVRI